MFYDHISASFKGICIFIQLHTLKKYRAYVSNMKQRKVRFFNHDTTTAIGKNRYKLWFYIFNRRATEKASGSLII